MPLIQLTTFFNLSRMKYFEYAEVGYASSPYQARSLVLKLLDHTNKSAMDGGTIIRPNMCTC